MYVLDESLVLDEPLVLDDPLVLDKLLVLDESDMDETDINMQFSTSTAAPSQAFQEENYGSDAEEATTGARPTLDSLRISRDSGKFNLISSIDLLIKIYFIRCIFYVAK